MDGVWEGPGNSSSVMERGQEDDIILGVNITVLKDIMNSDASGREQGMDSLLMPVIKAICVSVLFTTALAANLLVFAVFYHKPVLLTTSNKLLTHLSVTQCLLLLLVIPLWTASIFQVQWTSTAYACMISAIGFSTLSSVSIYTLVLVALDRFCAITRPLHYTRTVTVRRVTICLVCVWLFSLAISLPPLFGWGRITYHREQGICTADWSATVPLHKSYPVCVIFVCFVVPLIVKICLYSVIYCAARKATSRVKRLSLTPEHYYGYDVSAYMSQQASRRRSSTVSLAHMVARRRSSFSTRSVSSLMRDDLLAAKTALMALLSFVACWLPYNIVNTIDISRSPDHLPDWLHFSALYLVIMSCLVNPIVFVFRSKVVKETLCVTGYISLACKLCPCRKNPDLFAAPGPDRPFPPLLRILGRISMDPNCADVFETSDSQTEVRQIVTTTTSNSVSLTHAVV